MKPSRSLMGNKVYFSHIRRNVQYCGICGNPEIKLNRASTSFCSNCHYDISRGGKISRMISHPLYEKLGYRIKKDHPDFQNLNSHNNLIEDYRLQDEREEVLKLRIENLRLREALDRTLKNVEMTSAYSKCIGLDLCHVDGNCVYCTMNWIAAHSSEALKACEEGK